MLYQYFWQSQDILCLIKIALIVFYLTVKNDKKKEREKEDIINQNRLSHFSSLTKLSIKHIEDSINNLKLTIEIFEQDNITFHLMFISPNNSFGRFTEVVKSMDLFLAYINKFGRSSSDNFSKITLSIDFCSMQLAQMEKMHKHSQSYDHKKKLQYKKDIDWIINSVGSIANLESLPQEDKRNLDAILIEYFENHPKTSCEKDSFEYSYSFVRKVLEDILIKHLDQKTIYETALRIKGASKVFNEIKIYNDVYIDDLISIRETLEECLVRYNMEVKNLID